MLSLPKSIFPTGVLVLTGWLLTERAPAADDYSSAWTPPSLAVTVRNIGTPETGMACRGYLNIGTNEFAFTMPAESRLGNSAPQKVVLVSTNYDYSFTLRMVSPEPSVATDDERAEFYRGLVHASYPDARITDEFSRNAANRSGTAFDLRWKNSGGTMQAIRAAYVPFPGGILEFSVITTSDKFASGQGRFDTWLMTFGDKAAGSPDTVRISPAG